VFLAVLPFVVVARFPVAAEAADPHSAVAADGLRLPGGPPGNDGPQRPRALPRHPAALWVNRRKWRRPWPFVPCATQRVARLSADCAGRAGPAVAQQQLSVRGSVLQRVVPSEPVPAVGSEFAKQPWPLVACVVEAVAAHSLPLGGDGLAAVGRTGGAQKRWYGRPEPVPWGAQPDVVAVVVVAAAVAGDGAAIAVAVVLAVVAAAVVDDVIAVAVAVDVIDVVVVVVVAAAVVLTVVPPFAGAC